MVKLKDLNIAKIANDETFIETCGHEFEHEALALLIKDQWCIAGDILGEPDWVELSCELDLYIILHHFANDVYEKLPNPELTVDYLLRCYEAEDLDHLVHCAREQGVLLSSLMKKWAP